MSSAFCPLRQTPSCYFRWHDWVSALTSALSYSLLLLASSSFQQSRLFRSSFTSTSSFHPSACVCLHLSLSRRLCFFLFRFSFLCPFLLIVANNEVVCTVHCTIRLQLCSLALLWIALFFSLFLFFELSRYWMIRSIDFRSVIFSSGQNQRFHYFYGPLIYCFYSTFLKSLASTLYSCFAVS